MSLRRTYVLMRKILSDVGNEGCEGWEENNRWPRRNLGISKTCQRLLHRDGNLHGVISKRNAY